MATDGVALLDAASRSTAAGRREMVGRSVRRSEDERFLTGTGCYVGDLKLDRMAHAVVVRSPVAHAAITAIDLDAARALPGVLGIFVFADIERFAQPIPVRVGPLPGLDRFLQLPLARDRVRYVGEPVAVVVAEDPYVAEDAADLVSVDYAPLDIVPDVDSALSGAALVHPDAATNMASSYTVSRGDPDAAFASAPYVRRERFRCHRHGALPLETRGLVAQWSETEGRLRLWGATKVLFANRRILAGMLRLAEDQCELIEVDVGGSFGVRGDFYPEDFLIPFAAMRVGRPVKWIEDRREHLIATNHSREMECELAIAVGADGTVLGLRARLWADLGAYARTNGGVAPAKAAQLLPGPYRIAHFACEVNAVVTNKTPAGTYRGPGRYESAFFRERLLDMAAMDLGLDPVAFRLQNMLSEADMPFDTGDLVPYMGPSPFDTGDYPLALRRACEAIDYPRLREECGRMVDGKLRGVGVGCFVESTGGGPEESARIVLRSDGRVDLHLGSSTAGQGHETVMAQVAADALGLPMGDIAVFHGSTTGVPSGYGTYHSRTAVMGSGSVIAAAEAFIERLLEAAGGRLGVPRADLAYRDGTILAAGGTPVLCLEDFGDSEVEAVGTFRNDELTYTYGAQAAHVAVDPETAQVDVLRFVTVEDIGRAINPMLVHGQAIGAAVQGIGGTFLDQYVYDESGQLLTGTLADYLLPTSTDFPNVESITLEHARSPGNPLGVKGAGEGGIIATGAALANAVSGALASLGVDIRELPITPSRLADAMRQEERHGA